MIHRYIVQGNRKTKKNWHELLFPILIKEQTFFAMSTFANFIEK